MPNYRVTLTALAVVETVVEVEAASPKEASELAPGMTGDTIWAYRGVQENTIEIDDVTCEVQLPVQSFTCSATAQWIGPHNWEQTFGEPYKGNTQQGPT